MTINYYSIKYLYSFNSNNGSHWANSSDFAWHQESLNVMTIDTWRLYIEQTSWYDPYLSKFKSISLNFQSFFKYTLHFAKRLIHQNICTYWISAHTSNWNHILSCKCKNWIIKTSTTTFCKLQHLMNGWDCSAGPNWCWKLLNFK